jgi:hypothetical protein
MLAVDPGGLTTVLFRDPAASWAVGVGSSGDDEHPGPAVGSAGVGSPYNTPPAVIPQDGKVAKDGIEAEGNMPPYILQQYPSRS